MPVRLAKSSDLAAIADLLTQLGYPTEPADLAPRLDRFLASDLDALFVAVDGDRPVGMIHVGVNFAIEHDPRGVILALVVAEGYRNKHIGPDLVAAAETWARDKGTASIIVRSNVTRTEARRFYEREGYEVVKTSNIFEKRL